MHVKLSGISFHFGKDTILQDIDVTLNPGSLTLLCGQTGSGKSTLLQIAAGLEQPQAGSVSYLGTQDSPSKIGIVFQMPEDQLFAGTVRDDVEYGLKLRKVARAARLPKVEAALRMVGLDPSKFLDRSPFLLSGGEKRRVAIAGALALEPEFLILDEPTAGLDPEAAGTMREVLVQLRESGITILISTHDLDLFFPLADQVIVLQHGQTSYAGDVRGLLGKEEVLHEAGLELPAAASIASRLRQLGLQVDNALSVEELLPALRSAVAVGESQKEMSSTQLMKEQAASTASLLELDAQDTAQQQVAFHKQDASLLEKLDPRAKWLALVVLSIAMLSISSIWGLIAAVGISLAILRLGQIGLHRVLKLIRPFVPMFLFLWLIGAVTFGQADLSLGPVGITYVGAARSGLGVSRFLLIIILGIAFSESTTGAPLREGLEWVLRPLRKLKIPTRDISLAVTIAVQFLPWVLERIWQLRKAAQSRGQHMIGIRRFSPGQLTVLLVPLLISLIKMGDELATAIESRGYNREAERTSWYELMWTGKDTTSSLLAILVAGILLLG